MSWRILDCTLRDGGYYTDWDFPESVLDSYLTAVPHLPISIVELGYRALPERDVYKGAYYYLPKPLLERARQRLPDRVDLAVMLNAKSCQPEDIPTLLQDCVGLVKLVRLAVDPAQAAHAVRLGAAIKELGFDVGLNLMYLSKDYDKQALLEQLRLSTATYDYLSLVDSYGACYPDEVGRHVALAADTLPCTVGFHGHDNLTLAFANTISAIEGGARVVDATLLGMGRGAGNLRTEVIAAYYLNQRGEVPEFLSASPALEAFAAMKQTYGWGAELPYVIAGLNNLPQAEVMNWLSRRRYSTAAIVEALTKDVRSNSSKSDVEQASVTFADCGVNQTPSAIVLGGGPTATQHSAGIIELARARGAVIVHASTKHLSSYVDADVVQLVCLAGDEYQKMSASSRGRSDQVAAFVVDRNSYVALPSHPADRGKTVAVRSMVHPDSAEDDVLGRATPAGLALAAVAALGSTEVMLAGFDGYSGAADKDWLKVETQRVLDVAKRALPDATVFSITPTQYAVSTLSLYALLSHPHR